MFSLNTLNVQNQVRRHSTLFRDIRPYLNLSCPLQILYSLSQLSGRRSTLHGHKAKRRLQTSEAESDESLREAILHYDVSLLADIQNSVCRQLSKLQDRRYGRNGDFCEALDPWKVSFVSEDSFALNKNRNRPDAILTNLQITLNPSDILSNRFYGDLLNARRLSRVRFPVRGFKTDRTVVTENQRNPTLVQRIKKILGKDPSCFHFLFIINYQ